MIRKICTFLLSKIQWKTTDVFFVGYPKTGNTWQRFFLSEYVKLLCGIEHGVLFDDFDKFGRCKKYCINLGIQFTHLPLHWNAQTANDITFKKAIKPYLSKKVVLLIRSLPDTMVSWYYQCVYGQKNFSGTIDEFLRHKVLGIEKAVAFYNIWAKHKDKVKEFMVVRYEDRKKREIEIQRNILQFLNINMDETLLREAVSRSSFEAMRKLEMKGGIKSPASGLNIFGNTDKNNPNTFRVRKGSVNGYLNEMEERTVKWLESYLNKNLSEIYGYKYNFGLVENNSAK